jgi:hypothetical protein
MNNRIFSILGIGALLSPTFPSDGISTLVTKILERVLFSLNIEPLFAAVFSGIIGLSVAIYIFKLTFELFTNYIETNSDQTSKVLSKAILVFVGYQMTWMIIPFIDGALGQSYINKLNSSYELINKQVYYDLVMAPFWIIGTFSGIAIVYLRTKKVANIR